MMKEHDYKRFPELSDTQNNDYGYTSPHQQIFEDFEAFVVQVHDGDTITLTCSFRDFKFPLRFLDIDAPELNAGGDVARDYLKNLIENESVYIQIDKSNRVGKYGRLLGRVYHRGININEELLRVGLVFPFGKKFEHNLTNIDKELSLKQWLT